MPFGNVNYMDRLPVRLTGTSRKSEHPFENQQENLNVTCWASKYNQGQTHRNQHRTGNSNRGVKSQSMPSAKSGFPKPPAEYSTITERHNHRTKGKTRFPKVCWHTSTQTGSVQATSANVWPTPILVSQKEVPASLSAKFPNISSKTKKE